MNITPEVREVLNKRINELDRAIDEFDQSIEWNEQALGKLKERREEAIAKRVELANFQLYNGTKVFQQLVDDGWTPPEFLR